jgi:signal transduction histidine kinase
VSVAQLQAILVAWTAVTIFSVVLAAFLYWRQRAREYLAFGVLGAGSATYTAAAAQFYGATHAAEAGFWMEVEYSVGAIAFIGVCLFAHELVGRPSARAVRFLISASMVGIPLTLSGALVDPGSAVHCVHEWADLSPHRGAGVTGLFYAYTAFGVGALSYVVVQILRTPHEARSGRRLLAVALIVPGIAWTHDAALRFFHVEAPFLSEHAYFLTSLLISYLLLDRFVHTASALEERTKELGLRYDELRRVEEELVRKEQLAAVGELSAVIAHEVRNPLAVLRNAVAALRKQDLGEVDRGTLLEVLDEETNRLNRLVRDLLVYARPVEPQSVPLDLCTVLQKAVDLARKDHTRSTQVRVDFHIEAERTAVEGDPDLLERAFANVVENAIQAMPDGGALTIHMDDTRLEDGQPAVAILFSDTGEGMDTLVRSRARDPFFTTRPSGTGLGLAIVERVMRAHGGYVDLKSSDEDGGTTVTLRIPTRRPAKASASASDAPR